MKHIHGFLASSPLWKGTQFGLQQFELPSLDLTHFEPTPIPEKLRLGHQIEYIFHQLVSHLDAYEVVAHNIQIKKGNDTVGELDFLIRIHGSDTLLHLELTYKFYIIDPSVTDPIHQLVGPNRKDAFFAKLEKTKQKQLPLVYTEEGTQTLSALGINPTEITQKVLFMGQVFTPYHTTVPSIVPLDTVCIVGYWVHMYDFESDAFKDHTYYITYKSEWIHIPHNEVTWISHQDILPEIKAKHHLKRAPMLWVKKVDHSIDKCFVVWW